MLKAKDTSASALQKKKFSEKKFQRSPEKTFFQKIFQALHKLFTTQKIVLSSIQGQGYFRGLEASRPRPMDIKMTSKSKQNQNNSISGFQNLFWGGKANICPK